MREVSTIGLDIAKNVFQVHGVDRAGAMVVHRALRRSQVLARFDKLPRCLIGMGVCATAIIGRASCAGWGMRCG